MEDVLQLDEKSGNDDDIVSFSEGEFKKNKKKKNKSKTKLKRKSIKLDKKKKHGGEEDIDPGFVSDGDFKNLDKKDKKKEKFKN